MNRLKYAGWLVLLMGALSALQSPFVESFWIPYIAIFLRVVTSVYLSIAIIDLFYKVYCESRNVKTKVAFGFSIVCSLLFFVQYVLAFIIFSAALVALNLEWSVDVQNEVVGVFSGVAHNIVLVILLICAVLILIQYWSNNRIRSVLFMAIVMCLVYLFTPFLANILIDFTEGIRIDTGTNSWTYIHNGWSICHTVLSALSVFAMSALFFVFAENDSKSQSRNRGIDWVAFAVLLISIILFFCKWVKNADGESIMYGGHLITGGSLGLYLSLGGLLAIIFKSYRAKRRVGLAMIFWAFIAIGLAVFAPSVAIAKSSIYDVFRFMSEFGAFPELDFLVLGLYSGSCLVAGILLRRAGTVPESENRPEDQQVVPATEAIDGQADQLDVSEPADNMEDPQNVPDAESDPLDDEIAKLKAELERLKNEQNSL